MSANSAFRIAVLPGDGIGIEAMEPTLAVLDAVTRRVGGISLSFETHRAGAWCYRDTGEALPASTMAAARAADAILLGAMGWPEIRYADGTEIAPQLDLRFELELYAGVRPVRTIPALAPVLADPRARALDFVLIRESTEGLFVSRGKGVVVEDREARDTLLITRAVSERVFDFGFRLARQRAQTRRTVQAPSVTCVDKANVFTSFAFFRKVFDERAKAFPDIVARHAYVDAMALYMVQKPWTLDVLVTENMFGDILSDLGAGLMGGLGFAPSADIGDRHAIFQPCHGTAPDIAGKGTANPVACMLSGAMMLEWLGDRHGRSEGATGAATIRSAIDAAFAAGLRSVELGGRDGTRAITDAVLAQIATVQPVDR
ncbi:MAG: isocitrate/isopropylmalate dehydrogenase family protein [Hyphomicrobiaceae bacterium]